ncbi:MAG: endonuclease/exonuclease/phosphatase family protein [Bacteroidota bacterium]|nr:endonuclease/exonuclease/phosphatase family protein [Bacteroidota bacterium]
MKIATWNLGRPRKGADKINAIVATLSERDADILVLTETINSIDLGPQYTCFYTSKPIETYFRMDERRVAIYSKYDYYEEIATHRPDTSLCVHLDTPLGPIAVYGTCMGATDSTTETFSSDLEKRLQDFETIGKTNQLLICGDLNRSLPDNADLTEKRRRALTRSFAKNHLQNLTAGIPESVDQVVLSKSVENNCKVRTEKWNVSKTLSDHLGVLVSLIEFE